MKYPRIKELREDNDIRQQTIADYLFIAQNTYSQYENGLRDIPINVLSSIADYYNTSVDFLIGRTDNSSPYPKTSK